MNPGESAVDKDSRASFLPASPDGRGYTVTVTSAGTALLPVPVEAVFADGTRQRVTLDRELEEQTLEFTGTSALNEVVLDPDKAFPLVMPPPKMTEAMLAERLDEMPWTGAGDNADRLYKHAVGLDSKTRDVWRKLGLTLFEAGRYSEALDAFGRLSQVETDPKASWHFGAMAWMGLVNDVLHQRDAALSFYRRALATNSNSSQAAEALHLARPQVVIRGWPPFGGLLVRHNAVPEGLNSWGRYGSGIKGACEALCPSLLRNSSVDQRQRRGRTLASRVLFH